MTLTSYNKLKELGRQGILIRKAKRGREKYLLERREGRNTSGRNPGKWGGGKKEAEIWRDILMKWEE